MKLTLSVSQYVWEMRRQENAAISIQLLLEPFDIFWEDATLSPDLLVGHIIEQLRLDHHPNQRIDAMDICITAWELGFKNAEKFLDEGAFYIYRLLKEGFGENTESLTLALK